MLNNFNIDIYDLSKNTKYPFDYSCKLNINNNTLDPNLITDIKIFLNSNFVAPCRIKEFYISGNKVVLLISDNLDSPVGTALLSPDSLSEKINTCMILNQYNVLVGHIHYYSSLYNTLKSYLSLCRNSTYTTDPNDFIFNSSCIFVVPKYLCKSFGINNIYHTKNTTLDVGNYIEAVLTNNVYSISVYNDYKPANVSHGISILNVNGIKYWISGKHLYVRHSVASNIRVNVESQNITLKGVLDVQ